MKINYLYNKKYTELSLTGNIPQNPKYIYEYDLPKDFDEAIKVISALDNSEVEFEICLNRNNELVLNTNLTPAYLCYKPKQDTEEVMKDNAEEFKLQSIPKIKDYIFKLGTLPDIERRILTRIAQLQESNIEPKVITCNEDTYKSIAGSIDNSLTFQGYPIRCFWMQTADFLIGV